MSQPPDPLTAEDAENAEKGFQKSSVVSPRSPRCLRLARGPLQRLRLFVGDGPARKPQKVADLGTGGNVSHESNLPTP